MYAADPQLSTVLRRAGMGIGGLLVVLTGVFAVWVRRRMERKLGERAAGVSLGRWLWAMWWSQCMWAASYGVYYLAVRDPKVALALVVGVGFGSGIPSLPAGLGAYEATFLWVGERAHLPHEQVLAAAVVSHAVQLLTTLALGVPVLLLWGWPRAAPGEAASPGTG
jgi:uncharacterized membrane protein YbhN (UPF0104 family)